MRPFGTVDAAAGLLDDGLLAVMTGRGGPAVLAQGDDPFQFRFGLVEGGGSGAHLGFGLLALQNEIGVVEESERLAGLHGVADIDEPARHLAGHAEAEIALDARPDRRHEAALGTARLEAGGLDEHRPPRLRRRR